MKKVAVAIIHGVGHSDDDFADEFKKAVEDFVGRRFSASVGWIPLHWADLTEGRQRRYLERAKEVARLDWIRERELIIHMIGDAAAYQQKTSYHEDNTYWRVQRLMFKKFSDAWNTQFQGRDVPLIWVAHSLGCHVMSTFIQDTMRGHTYDSRKFLTQRTIRYVFTLGSPQPIFTFALPGATPIQLTSEAKWYNLYDRDDVWGWPLKPINAAYDAAVTEDIQVSVGGPLIGWNPLCHLGYWTDGQVIRRVGNAIIETLNSLPEETSNE
jgi:hypothetical protein